MQKILITGCAGFIGFHLTNRLAQEGFDLVGIDNINDYYETELKYARLEQLGIVAAASKQNNAVGNRKLSPIAPGQELFSNIHPNLKFQRLNLEDKQNILKLFETENFHFVINLAAQAGVRYSIENPDVYIKSNVDGFFSILEACRRFPVKHLVYASSSSVYGNNAKIPFSINDKVDKPVSLYAATKLANELMAETYSHLYKIQITGLRFFTVYGPWGRPDMAPSLFAAAIQNSLPIKIFNEGKLERDFTYVDDVVEGIYRVIMHKCAETPDHQLHNIGNGTPIKLMEFIETIEDAFQKKAKKMLLPMQPGDVKITWADTSSLEAYVSYKPVVKLKDGIRKFAKWYQEYYNIKHRYTSGGFDVFANKNLGS